MNVLIIAPHPDDEAIGCGGAACRHFERGDKVSVVFLTSGELGLKHLKREAAWKIREAEAAAAAKILRLSTVEFLRCPDWMLGDDVPGAAAKLAPVLQARAPELIYLPHPHDRHPDHQATLPVLRAALAEVEMVSPRLLGYEVWTPMTDYQHVENISAVMRHKLRALRKHQSQLDEFDYARAVRGLNEYRGVTAGRCRYAEVFQELAIQP